MGKKRKAGGQPFGHGEVDEPFRDDNKLRINTYEDVADSEDEFHINRDKILLDEGPVQKRQRKIQAEEDFLEPSDEEVLAVSEDVSESDDRYESPAETSQPTTKRYKLQKTPKPAQDSNSEASAEAEDDEDVGGWGDSRNDYYNADIIETEADALEEEAEAKRLQQKQLQGMTEADFGFDEEEWMQDGKEDGEDDHDDGYGNVVREFLPKLEVTDAMGPEERSKIMRSRYPEFEPLAKELLDLRSKHNNLKDLAAEAVAAQNHNLKGVTGVPEPEETAMPIALVKYSALSSYLGALSMYFALFTSGSERADGKRNALPPEELRDHSIMETLMQCRDLWQRVKDIIVPEKNGLSNGQIDVSNRLKTHTPPSVAPTNGNRGSEDKPKKPKHHKSKAQKAAETAQIEAETQLAERLQKTEEELATLPNLIQRSKPSTRPPKPPPVTSRPLDENDDAASDFGEQTTLSADEAAEKAQRKKSLRFYTSQLAQKSNKRDAAGRDAGGDADLPYRERLKDRQARLNAEAESRGKKPKRNSKGDALGGSSDDEDRVTAKALRDGEDDGGEEDYYDLVAEKAKGKKAAKAALAAAHAQAERDGGVVRVVDEEVVGGDGKRAISYMIEKNKGITPRRKKDVRNPRVKKRNKYESKMKKLGSTRPIFKGGEGRGGYQGEKTGIKKGLVKSVKL